MSITRRNLLGGLLRAAPLLAMPAIIRTPGLLMPTRATLQHPTPQPLMKGLARVVLNENNEWVVGDIAWSPVEWVSHKTLTYTAQVSR